MMGSVSVHALEATKHNFWTSFTGQKIRVATETCIAYGKIVRSIYCKMFFHQNNFSRWNVTLSHQVPAEFFIAFPWKNLDLVYSYVELCFYGLDQV